MGINDFDKIVKEQMEKMEITPSSSSRKLLGFKLFFANLIVFHKLKLYTGFFVLAGGIYASIYLINTEENEGFQEHNIVVVDNDVDNNEKEVVVIQSNENKHVNTNEINEENLEKEVSENLSSLNNSADASETIPPYITKEKNNYNSSDKSNTTNELNAVAKNHPTTNENPLDEKIENKVKTTPVSADNSNYAENKPQKSALNEKTAIEITVENMEKATIIPGGIITEVAMNNTLPNLIPLPQLDDYANNPKKRGFTIDAYFSPINKVDIDNQLDASLQEYYWDFYKEKGYVNSGTNGGININYNWNNFKLGTGMQINRLKDYKSKYEYFFLPGLFGNQFISGAIVYEQDTSLVFYVDPSNKELHKELKNSYNSYSYLNIPLTVGYEFDFKYLSLELNAGAQYGYLIKAKGVEVRTDGSIDDPLSAYFYHDKYLDLMTRKSEYLNKSQFSLLGNATLRVRLTPSFDFYASVNYTTSKKGIYKDNYFLQKTFNNYGTKFGVTYYMNKRLKIKGTSAPRF